MGAAQSFCGSDRGHLALTTLCCAGDTTPLYVRQIMPIILTQPRVAGILVYTTYFPLRLPCVDSGGDGLFGGDRGCIVKEAFSRSFGL